MIIKNGLVFQENESFEKRDLSIEHGRITKVMPSVSDNTILENTTIGQNPVNGRKIDTEINADGLYVLPGLIDIHSHGAVGSDYSDGSIEGLEKILSYERANGITSYCPTSMSMDKDSLLKLFQMTGNFSVPGILGFHMEGPFLDPSKKGAHREECLIPPDAELFRKCNKACGNRIRLVTIAPNTKGAMDFIKTLKEETTISLGHTAADYDTSKKALVCGARHITHLFNAMIPLGHREPGLIGAAAESDNCYAELICDGIHLHESAVRAAFRLFPDKIVLISDSIRATGLEDGTYELGGQKVTVKGKLATLQDGTIAGSVTNLFDCMRNAVSFGIPLEKAVAAATINPAKSIGVFDEIGSLSVGKKADILLVDKNLNLVKVLIGE